MMSWFLTTSVTVRKKQYVGVELISNRTLALVIGDIRNKNLLYNAMSEFKPDSVMHFAGFERCCTQCD